MIKANTRYTAREILIEAGIDADAVIGKMRVIIGGLTVNDAGYVIRIPTGTESLEIITGVDSIVIEIEAEAKEQELSEGVQAIEDAKTENTEEEKAK